MLTRNVARVKNRIKSFYRSRGVPCSGEAVYRPGERAKRQFWAYCGFGVVMRSSSDWVREDRRWVRAPVVQSRGLNWSFNRTLKALFKGAATTVLAHSGPNPLRAKYDRLLETGTKPNLAKLTIARHLAALVLALWKTEKRYDPGRLEARLKPAT